MTFTLLIIILASCQFWLLPLIKYIKDFNQKRIEQQSFNKKSRMVRDFKNFPFL
jgi:hypothetical protein